MSWRIDWGISGQWCTGCHVPVLILLLSVVLSLGVYLHTMQYRVVEMLQRRVFVRIVAELVNVLRCAQPGALRQAAGSELLNRFFDLFTAKKALSSLLLGGLDAALVVLVGLVLLAALGVDVELQDNQLAPDANARVQVTRDLGGPVGDDTLPGTVLSIGLDFSLPGLMRKARGKLAAARAKLAEAQYRLTFAEDKLRAAVRDARSQLVATIQRAAVSERMIATSRLLAEGERQRLDAGTGTLLSVNLREQAVAVSEYEFIGAAAEAQLAGFSFEAIAHLCKTPEPQARLR